MEPCSQWIQQFEKTCIFYDWNESDKISQKALRLNYEKVGCRVKNVEIFIERELGHFSQLTEAESVFF